MGSAPYGGDARVRGDAQGDAVQPGCDRVAAADRAGPPGQDQEGRLCGLFGVVFVTQDLTADAQNHGPMPVDQRGEGGLGELIAPFNEALEQIAVGEPRGRAGAKQRVDLLEQHHFVTRTRSVS